ncbi:Sulfate permease 2 [Ceratocystis lukuohia]|uniref:Sulfate permease 2 n=1 Tax=Ceratocystis lukuohia TaxID=2019550 RepID=A0ABR4MRV9_9PEZI
MPPSSSNITRLAAKAVGIDLDYRDRLEPTEILHETAHSIPNIEPYIERDPSAKEWLSELVPTGDGVANYVRSLFPFWTWIFHYNLTWMLGDVIAGVTVGFVVIPQGMAYALLAQLGPEYGLYTSFVGFILYWAFATSKDITIGTVAVMSTLVGQIVERIRDDHPQILPEDIARALAVISGAVLLFLGLTRLGWIVEFIPLVAITSFMTGAAFSIAVGQVPKLLGLSGVNTRDPAYEIVINIFKKLDTAKGWDAAMGLSALFLLYGLRWLFNYLTKHQPQRKKLWFFLSTLRMAFVILLYILISWLVNKDAKTSKAAKFSILGKVPSGFQHAGVPTMNPELMRALAPDIPATIIVLIIEHIAISKSFGRINNYVINPSQELVAVGFTNLLGPFLGAYPATGSFSRTAIKSKAGVRTPLAGIFTAVIVLLALYALTSVFYYIPMASLSGLIIHAVGDLMTPPNVVFQFWEVSPFEVIIFFAGVLLTVFTNIENGIYLTICASAALLLVRLSRTKGRILGTVNVEEVAKEGQVLYDEHGTPVVKATRQAFIPINAEDGHNPKVDVAQSHPGVIIYRFQEGFSYANSAQHTDNLVDIVFRETRRTLLDRYEKLGDRPWNDPGPRRGAAINVDDQRPILRAIILDFSSVNNLDVTSIQALIDVRNQLDRYASPEFVEWHFANVSNRWARRALATAGFGYPSKQTPESVGRWKPIFSIASVDAADKEIAHELSKATKVDEEAIEPLNAESQDHKNGQQQQQPCRSIGSPRVTISGANRPFFHVDLTAALKSVMRDIPVKVPSPGSDKGEGVQVVLASIEGK